MQKVTEKAQNDSLKHHRVYFMFFNNKLGHLIIKMCIMFEVVQLELYSCTLLTVYNDKDKHYNDNENIMFGFCLNFKFSFI